MAAETNEVMKSETLERQLCQEAQIRRNTLRDKNQLEWLRVIEIHLEHWEAKQAKVSAKLERLSAILERFSAKQERLQKQLRDLEREEMQEYKDMLQKDRQYMESVEEIQRRVDWNHLWQAPQGGSV